MEPHTTQIVLLLGFLSLALCIGESKLSCLENERQALLEFKGGLRDPHNLLASWEGGHCCNWRGVKCNNETKNVVRIDLRYPHLFDGPSTAWRLGGDINASLLGLNYLNYLDLSFNDFRGINIPEIIGSIQGLSYLNLSNAGFSGMIPSHLGNLSSLRYLDLNSFYSLYTLYADDLEWLSHLSSLQYLDMNSVNLSNTHDWFRAINVLPSLSVLHLSNCQLKEMTTSLTLVNLTSLVALDLSNNQFISRLPNWLFNMSNLEYLNLQFNHFHGSIPDAFANMTSLEVMQLAKNRLIGPLTNSVGKLCNLRTLDLSSNNISDDVSALAEISSGCVAKSLEILNLRGNTLIGKLSDWLGQFKKLYILDLGFNLIYGPLPDSIGELISLRNLYLSNNKFNGTLPESIGQLSELRLLDVSSNSLSGTVSEIHFENLSKLDYLSLALNSFVISMGSEWVPPFRLTVIGFRFCKLGPKFPPWLQTQKDFGAMDLSNGEINDTVPDWLWTLSQEIYTLDLSRNQLTGEIPATLMFSSISLLDLSFNKLHGPLPPLPSSIEYVDFSSNSFSGTITLFDHLLPSLSYLLLSSNIITGTIPSSVCQFIDLYAMDLSNNFLYGELPECLGGLTSIAVIDLGNNYLSGNIPSSIGTLSWLQALHLGNNSINGKLPQELKSCTRLETLDVGENRLEGEIPTWIGESLPNLRILRLRSNMFHGFIPPQISLLASLQILDLADNTLSGIIPHGFGDITAMALTHKPKERMLDTLQSIVQASLNNYGPSGFVESLLLVMKGTQREYSKNLQYVSSIDLSGNNLSGDIPHQLMNLYGLQNLNLSGNTLTGKIPENIGQLSLLESLDLSRNNFGGSIPTSMSMLTFLSYLNLSYNNFSGKIPSGNQLQTLGDPFMYIGNPGLCGPPLDEECKGSETNYGASPSCGDEDHECESEMLGFYICISLGFVAGFWAIWGTLLFSKTLSEAYFNSIDRLLDKVPYEVDRTHRRH